MAKGICQLMVGYLLLKDPYFSLDFLFFIVVAIDHFKSGEEIFLRFRCFTRTLIDSAHIHLLYPSSPSSYVVI